MPDFDALRQRMVKEQLQARGINQKKVLDAFLKVPRHLFVKESSLNNAYGDYPLPIVQSQTISQPYIVALMIQLLGLSGEEKVLEIGTGSGYQTALLAEIAKEVYSLERISSLAESSKELLSSQGYNNIRIKCSDGCLGWEEFAPFDAIIVSAATSEAPAKLLKQLKDNGRMVIPLGGSFSQVLTRFTRQADKYKKEEICGCVFVPLIREKKNF